MPNAKSDVKVSKKAVKNALDDVRAAGEMQAVNYGPPEDTVFEAIEDLANEGYDHLRSAVQVLKTAGYLAELERAFWAGYRDGSN